MIITQCACCAAPLPRLAKQCSRCKTRYCGPACQKKDWEEGGHDTLCKRIRKGGGAEQYYADQKYTAAVIVAARACAEDTQGQTCYVCTQAVHWKTKEALVRMCACRGTSGFVHVSCLAEQARILCEEAEENNLDIHPRWDRWYTCGLCEQDYHGVVYCALGWACWKTYLGRLETDQARRMAMATLGNGLYAADQYEDALTVREAHVAAMRRVGASEHTILATEGNLAGAYYELGRFEEALRLEKGVYIGILKLKGEESLETSMAAYNYADSLVCRRRFEEARSLLRKIMPVARRVPGESHDLTLKMRRTYAQSLYEDDGSTHDDLREAVNTLEETERIARRVFGDTHPTTGLMGESLKQSRAALGARGM